MSCMSQNFRLFHVSNLSLRNFRIFLLMYPGSVYRSADAGAGQHSTPRRPSAELKVTEVEQRRRPGGESIGPPHRPAVVTTRSGPTVSQSVSQSLKVRTTHSATNNQSQIHQLTHPLNSLIYYSLIHSYIHSNHSPF